MRADIQDAIENARTATAPSGLEHGPDAKVPRTISAERLRQLLLAVLRELPEELTVLELRDELDDGVGQRHFFPRDDGQDEADES